MIPSAIAEEAVVSSLEAYPSNEASRRAFVRAYAQAFLDYQRRGERLALTTTRHGDEPSQKGYDTAKSRILEGRGDLWLSPAEFGYSQIEVIGQFRRLFEISEFVTSDGEKLHLNLGFLKDIPEQQELRLKAWLSPRSALGFGHFNQWQQELIAIEIIKEDNG